MEEGGTVPMVQAEPAYAHPVTAFFHVFFKAVAIIWYIVGTWFVKKSFVINFVIVTLLLALDFWTVKNVSGRLLVGLRWWNEVEEDGSSAWRFESLDEGQRNINAKDKYIFWMGLYVAPVAWALFVILAVFSFSSYILISIIGVTLSGTNVYGYYKCSKEQKQKMENFARGAMQGAMQRGIMNAFNRIGG